MDNSNNTREYINDLIIKYLSKDISDEELKDLWQWIELSGENKDIFNRFKSSWMLAGAQAETATFNAANAYNKLRKQTDQSSERRSVKIQLNNLWKYAAVGLICLAMGSLLTWFGKTEDKEIALAGTTITAPLGAKSLVDLPDGTKVWLNAGSKIVYNAKYGKSNRTVSLTGEAYFDVAKNKDLPFLVSTSQLTVKALGTRFNVKAYPEEKTITTTLEEGKIEVETINNRNKGKKVMLNPNEKVVYYKVSDKLEKKEDEVQQDSYADAMAKTNTDIEVTKNVNTSLYTSWKDNRWILNGVSLGSLGVLMERRFNITMVFNSEELRNYKFTGTIENETLEQILNAFKFTAPVAYKITKDTVIIDLNTSLMEKYKKVTRE